jgi:hypothetical protein
MLTLACVTATIYFSAMKSPLAGIVDVAEHTVWPNKLTGLGNDLDLVSSSVNSLCNHGWSSVMRHTLWSLIIAGIFLHAFLVYFEINERLQKRQQWRRPILWKALAMMGALLIAIPSFNEIGGILT